MRINMLEEQLIEIIKEEQKLDSNIIKCYKNQIEKNLNAAMNNQKVADSDDESSKEGVETEKNDSDTGSGVSKKKTKAKCYVCKEYLQKL